MLTGKENNDSIFVFKIVIPLKIASDELRLFKYHQTKTKGNLKTSQVIEVISQ